MAKRALDLVVAGALLVVLSPVFAVVIAAYLVDCVLVPTDRGPLFYREIRISRGRRFGLLKFRTLKRDVLAQSHGHARPHEADVENLTWLGRRILKPWYLDEIPQLLNVLRGDISLVGPRPWPPHMVERQVAEGLDYRLHVTAGLTGPAQITKGSGRLFADLDTDYVAALATLSGVALIRHDARILLRTVGVMLRRQGLSY